MDKNQTEKYLREMVDLLDQMQKKQQPRKRLSIVEKEVNRLEEALDRIYLVMEKLREELPADFSPEEMSPETKSFLREKADAGVRFEVKDTQYTQEELLQRLSKKSLEDYCKYLRLPAKTNDSKSVLAQRVSQFLAAEETSFWSTFDREGLVHFRDYRKGCINKSGQGIFPVETVRRAAIIGYLKLEFSEDEEGRELITICVTPDFLPHLERADSRSARRFYSDLKRTNRQTMSLLNLYGMIEIPALYELYQRYTGTKMTQEEYTRYLYWHLRMRGEILTGQYHGTDRPFAALVDIDAQKAAEIQYYNLPDLGYKDFGKKVMSRYMRDGLGALQPALYDLDNVLNPMMEDEEAEDIINELVSSIQNGESTEELLEEIEEEIDFHMPGSNPAGDLIPDTGLWHIAMSLVMETPLPALKGWSRRELMEQGYSLPRGLSVFDDSDGIAEADKTRTGTILGSRIQPETRLIDMPEQLQLKIYELTADGLNPEVSSKLAMIRDLYGDNIQIRVLESEGYIASRKIGESIKTLREAAALTAGDLAERLHAEADRVAQIFVVPSVSAKAGRAVRGSAEAENTRQDSPEATSAAASVKARRKIGRNEPCPCGSGKKYKYCCGRS